MIEFFVGIFAGGMIFAGIIIAGLLGFGAVMVPAALVWAWLGKRMGYLDDHIPR